MSPFEKRAVAGLSFIYVARMLGLFMLMPVLALDNDQLRYSTPVLLGLAIGIYGLGTRAQHIATALPFYGIQDSALSQPAQYFGNAWRGASYIVRNIPAQHRPSRWLGGQINQTPQGIFASLAQQHLAHSFYNFCE